MLRSSRNYLIGQKVAFIMIIGVRMETESIMGVLEQIADIDVDLFKILADIVQSDRLERFLKKNPDPVSAKKFWIYEPEFGAAVIPPSCVYITTGRRAHVDLPADTKAGKLCRILILFLWAHALSGAINQSGSRGLSGLKLCRICGHQIIGGRSDKVYCSDGCKKWVNGKADLMRKREKVWETKWKAITPNFPFSVYRQWLDGDSKMDYMAWLKSMHPPYMFPD